MCNNIRNLIIQKSGTMKIKYVEPESQSVNIYVNSYFYDYIMEPRQKFVLPTKCFNSTADVYATLYLYEHN